MAHALDFTKGQAAIAYRGETPWHGLGESILPQDSIDDIRIKAGIDYDVEKTPVLYSVPMDSERPGRAGGGTGLATDENSCVLYRSDTGGALSVVSNKYQVVQPKQIIEFYRDLTESYGFELEVVGALKGGRKAQFAGYFMLDIILLYNFQIHKMGRKNLASDRRYCICSWLSKQIQYYIFVFRNFTSNNHTS